MAIGPAIRSARIDARLSQEALARAVGVKQPSVSAWERGENEPSLDLMSKIEDACGLPRGALYRLAGLAGDEDIALSADGLVLAELRDADPEAYRRLVEDMRWHLARAKERRER